MYKPRSDPLVDAITLDDTVPAYPPGAGSGGPTSRELAVNPRNELGGGFGAVLLRLREWNRLMVGGNAGS